MLQYAKNRVKSHSWPDRPEYLNLELTAVCDAKCIHCPRHDMDRKVKPIDFELFKKIVDEAAELKVPIISPNGYGELLTLKNLPDYLAYIRSKKHRFTIAVNTNAHQFDEEKRKMFFEYEVDFMNVCLDGATHETMAKVREKLNPARIENNLNALFKERKERKTKIPKVRLGFVVIPENQHETEMFLKKWKGIADIVGLDGYSNRLDSVKKEMGVPGLKSPGSCVLPFNTLNIWSDGKSVICCQDWNEEHLVGDVNSETIKQIWTGKELTKIRDAHMRKMGKDIEACKKCNFWTLQQPGQMLWK